MAPCADRLRSGSSGRAATWARSVLEHRIEPLRSLAEDPVLLARLGEGKGPLGGVEDLLQGPERIGEIRTPGDALRPEGVDHLAEEGVGLALAPALRADIDGRHLEVDLRVLCERE